MEARVVSDCRTHYWRRLDAELSRMDESPATSGECDVAFADNSGSPGTGALQIVSRRKA